MPAASLDDTVDFSSLEAIISPLYMVGGSVRDEIIGRTIKDYDFATPLSPDEIEARIRRAGKRPHTVGKRFGTIGVKFNGQWVEITTFRSERYVAGNRKPEVAFLADITADLSRRDFTMNAIARRGDDYIDPFHGRADIQARVIRAVGKPVERFKEDPLRMLRAARFASELDFDLAPETLEAGVRLADSILTVSRERWGQEFDKLLMGSYPAEGLEVLRKTRLLNYIIPELSLQVDYDQNSPYHRLPLWDHTLKVVAACPPDVTLRWAALLHDIAKPFVRTDKADRSNYLHHERLGAELVKRLGPYLRWSAERTEKVAELVAYHLSDASPLRAYDNQAK